MLSSSALVGWAARVLSLAFGTGKALEKNNYYPKGSVGARVQDLHSIALSSRFGGWRGQCSQQFLPPSHPSPAQEGARVHPRGPPMSAESFSTGLLNDWKRSTLWAQWERPGGCH